MQLVPSLLTIVLVTIVLVGLTTQAWAEETFVSIQQVSGNRIAIVESSGGRGMRGGAAMAGRGPRGGFGTAKPTIVTVPGSAKVTTAMRERRTFEFRVGAELAGGLRHRIFQNLKEPLQARVVTEGDRITEINVITVESDINQSNASVTGEAVIAVRPKRPPMKRN